MSIKEDDVLIDKLLNGKLSPEEEAMLRQRKANKRFVEKLSLYISLKKVSRSFGRQQILSVLKAIDEELDHEETT